LRDLQLRRRLTKVQRFGDRNEVPQMPHFHTREPPIWISRWYLLIRQIKVLDLADAFGEHIPSSFSRRK
jgi:hypothetical protein